VWSDSIQSADALNNSAAQIDEIPLAMSISNLRNHINESLRGAPKKFINSSISEAQ
jgi:hypothetical protein